MRLIDADALIEKWYEVNDIGPEDRGARFIGYTEIPRFINNAPTVETTGDYISRADAICEVLVNDGIDNIVDRINDLPSAEPKWNCTANFVAEQLDRLRNMTDEERWDFLIRFFSPSADRPSGEWKYLHGSIGSYMTMSCPFCGETFNDVAEWKYNYCPNCGARMIPYKGGDDE